MRRFLFLLLALPLLLAGCASTIRSEVTAFHQWPSSLADKSFAFERTDAQAQSLEYRSYEAQVGNALIQLGMHASEASVAAALRVKFDTSINGRDVRIVETVLVDPWYGTPWYGPGAFGPSAFGPYWGGWPGAGYPFYSPMWPSMPVAREQERRYTVFHRELTIKITAAADGQPLYEVTVRSVGKEANLAKVMPYLVQSAFADFPGKSGVPRVVELKMKE